MKMTRNWILPILVLSLAITTPTLVMAAKGGKGKPGGAEDPPPEPELPPIEYRVTTVPLPDAAQGMGGTMLEFNNEGMAVGRFVHPDGQSRGWLYDPALGSTAIDVNTLDIVGLPAGWLISYAYGINNNGLIVGYVSPIGDTETQIGYILDRSVTPAQMHFPPDPIGGWTSTLARKVNDNGDVLGTFIRADGTEGAYIYSSGLRSNTKDDELEILDIIPTNTPLIAWHSLVMNNPPEGFPTTVAANFRDSDGLSHFVVYTRNIGTWTPPFGDPPVNPALNDFGGVACRGAIEVQIRKNRTEIRQVVYRNDATEDYIEGYYGIVSNLLNSGAIFIRQNSTMTVYLDDWGFVDIASLTVTGALPTEANYYVCMNNTGPLGVGQIAIKERFDGPAEIHILTPYDISP